MRIEKLPLNSHRIRRIPPGFGWVDHRIVRNRLVRDCSTDSLALYLVLVCVSDQDGLSYYGDALLCSVLGWSYKRLETARSGLEKVDLIAWSSPLYQVLEVPGENGEVCYD
jgi:hypothetical protein